MADLSVFSNLLKKNTIRKASLAIAVSSLLLSGTSSLLANSKVPESQAEIALSFAPVVKMVAPAVVNIYVHSQAVAPFGGSSGGEAFENYLREMMPQRPRVQNSLGSGVIIGSNGLVVTNNHVVAGEEASIKVVLSDRREYAAKVIISDRSTDLAVLQLEDAENLPTLALRNSDTVETGDLVLAIGNPFGVGQTITQGIISALARGMNTPAGRGYFIQTDASINPGNSGGALVDMQGNLIGVNSSILSKSGGSVGIGFAVPSNLVREVVAQAMAGRVTLEKPWAGVITTPITPELQKKLQLPTLRGVAVALLHQLSPFVEAGLQPRDVIVAADGGRVDTPEELDFRMAAHGMGGDMPITILRDGKQMQLQVRMIAPPELPPRDPRTVGGEGRFAGVKLVTINPALIEQRDMPLESYGVLVNHVTQNARISGMITGDIIQNINGETVGNSAQAAALMGNGPKTITLIRGKTPVHLKFE